MPPEQNSTTTTDDASSKSQSESGELGDAGKRALAAERARAAEAERAHKAEQSTREKLEAQLEKLREATQSESEKAIERAKREAAEQTRKDVLGVANRRILTAEVRAAAGGRLADPMDAVRLLDVSSFSVGDDGEVDGDAITKAIDELLTAKPYLAANDKRFTGSADGGARQTSDNANEVSPGLGRLVSGYALQSKK